MQACVVRLHVCICMYAFACMRLHAHRTLKHAAGERRRRPLLLPGASPSTDVAVDERVVMGRARELVDIVHVPEPALQAWPLLLVS